MLKIAVCDDDRKVWEHIKGLIVEFENDFDCELTTTYFINGEDLCISHEKSRYDIICMDIVMDGINGVETAKRLRAVDKDVTIIFMSSYDDYLRELFGVKTAAFIDKPIDHAKFKTALSEACNSILENSKMTYVYSYNKAIKWVYIKDICYFENDAHLIKIHLKDSVKQYYDTMANVWRRVQGLHKFVMPSISFVIHVDFIEEFQSSEILMKSGERVPISRRFQGQVAAQIFKNIRGE